MLELIRSWLIGITCAAMIVALAEGLTPPGAIRKVGKLTGGLVLLLAILQPILGLDGAALTRSLTEYRLDLSAYSDSLEEENGELMKEIIAEQSAAYIVDKAAELGISCQVTVETVQDGDYPVPETVTVIGELDMAQQEALKRQIETDFAIPAQRQYYKSGGEGKG
ncbi:stage III sporulation protein AF [Lawsonibacter celer]|jgi:stage III sporulation protein AF|uniref:stage III sporulation protein AF n=1 Tax=Lawsonibacter celer TaxID=2986526 RepID=UPI001647F23E|nr:stage III sporulation protein AF [Lawsonibacter celer]